ncbi:hypothetical protein LMG28688_07128 [Paraburkholderia caffeinitolerans]|uniref:Glycine zipper domain-containing protein n=1 Tax=Paraburkholderia caffeinitolerans TaxID=1723730 RepID=A0A6J5H1I0_9BURK|nr:hypothetical protein [Paraburkholderia caffeinitolerans]CAB3810032.1 hypothetical protein LMG28688_07128 [Paraburkholderia caffeinitolerans]
MSQIVAARFTTFDAAEAARKRLLTSGLIEEDVAEFYVNPGGQHARYPIGGDEYADPQARPAGLGATGSGAIGAVVGAAVAVVLTFMLFHAFLVLAVATLVGAYVGTLIGALLLTRGASRANEPGSMAMPHERESGVLLAVHVNSGMQARAVRDLRETSGQDIEIASGLWQDGRWADFDPTRRVKPLDSDGSVPASGTTKY